METAYGIPLQFRNAVTHADNACAHFTESQEICHTCHEALIKCGHQLYYAVGGKPGAGK